eukprot:gene47371-63489_t
MPPPPYALEDNPQSWFEHADLVFIDPPHTGYSLTASDEARKKAFSVDGDVAVLCEVMKAWLTRHQRWGSPIYLCGESYGTTRACAMADKLCSQGLPLAGLVLVSCAMDIQALEFSPRNDLPYAVYLPAFAGVAQYHGCLSGSLGASGEAARAAATGLFALVDGLMRHWVLEPHAFELEATGRIAVQAYLAGCASLPTPGVQPAASAG